MRIATYNVENLDFPEDERNPSLNDRKPFLRAMLKRANADILCLQEVHAQETDTQTSSTPSRELAALKAVIEGTPYAGYHLLHTETSDKVPYDARNLVVLSRYPIIDSKQYRNDLLDKLQYKQVTANVNNPSAKDVSWERPIFRVSVQHEDLGTIHVINLHFKSRIASNIKGQKVNNYTWRSAAGWAEGYFLSSIKRVGQALETRMLVDQLLDSDRLAKIVVCGDFNAEPGEVPVEAICGRVENTGNPKLRSRVLVSCNNSIPKSVRFSHIHQGKGNLLDHMLISQAMLPYWRGSEILNENLHDESAAFASDIKYPESDHAPYISEFSAN